MNANDEDRPLGVPVMSPRRRAETRPDDDPAPHRSDSSAPDPGRHPADELGLAKQLPSGMHAPTKQEMAAVEASDELEARRSYDEAMHAGLSRFSQWGRLADRTLLLAVLAVAALLGLIVFSQTFQILAVVALQPLALRLLAYAGLIAIFAILIVFSTRLLVLFLRLRVNQQISATQLQELSGRAELRTFVQRDKAAAKKNLEAYLSSYPFDQACSMSSWLRQRVPVRQRNDREIAAGPGLPVGSRTVLRLRQLARRLPIAVSGTFCNCSS